MGQGESNRASVYYSSEATWNETPSTPVMIALPITGESLGHKKVSASSEEIRDDRMIDNVTAVGASAEGDVNFELQYSDFLTLLEGALNSAFTTFTYTGAGAVGNLQFTGNDIVGPANTWNALVVGQYVKVSGASQSANNGIRKVTAKTSTNLTVDGAVFAAENSSTATVKGKVVRNATTKKSFLIEKRYADLSKFFYFRGMRVGQLRLNVESQKMITGSLSFMGAEGIAVASSIGNATSTAESTDPKFNATANVGTLTEGGAAITTAIRALAMVLNNNLRKLDGVASRVPIGINTGSVNITGSIEAYFEDITLLNKFINHTSSSLSWRLTDPSGNVLIFTLPKLYFDDGNPDVRGVNQDVMLPLNYQAVRDPTTNCMIQIDALTA